MNKQFSAILKSSLFVSIFAFGAMYAFAWTAPSTTPPDGNVLTPLNTSSDAQEKAGGLTVDSLISTKDITVNGIIFGRGGNSYYGNTAAGDLSLISNLQGVDNTAFGEWSLTSNTDGTDNAAFGAYSLIRNSVGTRNTAIGTYSLFNAQGDGNTGTGYNSLMNNYSGSDNTAVGRNALYYSQTGSYNTAVGSGSLTYSNGSYNTAIGYGTSVPFGGSSISNSTAIGNGAIVDASNKVRIGNTAVTVIGGQVAWSNLSDARTKEDIVDYTHGLDFITKLRPVSFKFKSDSTHTKHSGFIAQEVEATGVPFYGINKPESKDGHYSLSYSEFVVPLVNSVKELKAENDSLKAENKELLRRIELIEAKLK